MREIVIVGHGHSMTGSGLGEKIDQYPTVRMKRSKGLMQTYPKDYGKRIDYVGATSAAIIGTIQMYPTAKEYLVYPKAKFGQTHFSDKQALKLSRKDPRVKLFKELHDYWLEIYQDITPLDVRYSTGMGLLITSLDYFKPEIIYLAGFDSILNPETDWSSVLATREYDWENDPPHDFRSENHLLNLNRS
jgi:hypothetical protein